MDDGSDVTGSVRCGVDVGREGHRLDVLVAGRGRDGDHQGAMLELLTLEVQTFHVGLDVGDGDELSRGRGLGVAAELGLGVDAGEVQEVFDDRGVGRAHADSVVASPLKRTGERRTKRERHEGLPFYVDRL